MSEKWPAAATKLIEDKANGSAVLQSLGHEISGLIAVNPDGGKTARAQAVSPQVESGNVYLPHPAIAPWVDDFIEECASFPNGRFDDCVDACSQALNRLRAGRSGIAEFYLRQCEDLARRRGVTLEQLLANPGLSRGKTVRMRSWPVLLA
jgi:phage terminase large subunit-like protein